LSSLFFSIAVGVGKKDKIRKFISGLFSWSWRQKRENGGLTETEETEGGGHEGRGPEVKRFVIGKFVI
jgi:hypothetical protein